MTTARVYAVAAPLPDGKVLIAGGGDYGSPYYASAEVYDPATGTFSATGSMTTPRANAIAAPLPDGKVLIAGGAAYNGPLSSAELYDPATGTFSALTQSMTTQRLGTVAAPLPDGKVLIAGGKDSNSNILSSAEVYEPAPEVQAAGGLFGDQTIREQSASQTIRVMNIGAQALSISGAALGGADHGDFRITADACAGRRLAFEQACTINVSFAPSATGGRSATIALTDNEPNPTVISLSGTGMPAVRGPQGPRGQRGQAGQVRLVRCTTVTVHRHRRRHCTTRLISGTARFTIRTARARLTRAGVTYATGTVRNTRLVLHAHRRLTAGHYRLILRYRRDHRWITKRDRITIR